ncbi:MAG: PIN domain-containing protein [Candidatus Bathyarchaeia archaeon]
MKKLNAYKDGRAFLDTTFLLPFFQLDIAVEAFTIENFEDYLQGLSEIHVSELSVFEAKAKIFRLSRKNPAYTTALKNFGRNLTLLREDEKFFFHPYMEFDDVQFNLISSINQNLDSFDIIILAQASNIGLLITEDKEILSLRQQEKFKKNPLSRKLLIKPWKELIHL